MDLQLNGKRILITGGSKGIGKAIAASIYIRRSIVTIAARDRDVLRK